MGIDVGNEFNMYGLLINKFSTDEGDRWLAELLGETEKLFRGKSTFSAWIISRGTATRTFPVGLYRASARLRPFIRGCGLRRARLRRFSEESLSLQEYNVELANRAPSERIEKSGFRNSESRRVGESNEFGRFVYESMLNATRSDNLFGFTFWCSHDVDRKFVFDEIEYDLGLFDVNNKSNLSAKFTPTPLQKLSRSKTRRDGKGQNGRYRQNPSVRRLGIRKAVFRRTS
ncbi:MAG: hypothetical protein ACLUSP_03250 [Christensenellales bacterium]